MNRKVKDVLGRRWRTDDEIVGVNDLAYLWGMTPGNLERLLRELRTYGVPRKLYAGMKRRGMLDPSEPTPSYIKVKPCGELIPKNSRGRYCVSVERAMQIYYEEIEQWRWHVNSKGQYPTVPSDLNSSLPKEYLKNPKAGRKKK